MIIRFEIITKCPQDGHEYMRFGIELWWFGGNKCWRWLPNHHCPICQSILVVKPQKEIDRFFKPE